ncbi:hypothetical protein [Clostridium tyrobutyricum]|uniref:hypothetical protein n=1 Tax=Clostridium tyrobutyricum TaxID=1519 RepID=UPI00073D82DA|nr:hypothetical protein [Clostridium tyrobutyricum]
MGFERFLKKILIPEYNAIDMAQKIVENGVVDGIKEKIKEDLLEDTPVISHIYNVGKYDGKKDGYAQASHEYEKKLLKQADEFLKQANVFKSDKVRYEKLIDDYERYIDKMMQKGNMSNEEKDYMNQIMVMERRLKKIRK